MPDRAADLARFLEGNGWDAQAATLLAGDASARIYLRVGGAGGSAVVMDAPGASPEAIRRFAAVAGHLRALGLSAPAIHDLDAASGFVLMEDLGEGVFARLLETGPGAEADLYAAATDLLVALHRAAPMPGLDAYGPERMGEMVEPAWIWYVHGGTPAPDPRWSALKKSLTGILRESDRFPTVMLHRDYHAENLVWLPDRAGPARVGLLDFQDAVLGHPAYDLASLLQDARRDLIGDGLEDDMISRYCTASGYDPEGFRAAYAAQAAQRQIRILGIFAALALRDGKRRYLALLPRVWSHLDRALAHPALTPLRPLALALLPPPGESHPHRLGAA